MIGGRLSKSSRKKRGVEKIGKSRKDPLTGGKTISLESTKGN